MTDKKDSNKKKSDFPAFGNSVAIDLSHPTGMSEGEVNDKEWYMKQQQGERVEKDPLADFREKVLFITENAGKYLDFGNIKSIHYRTTPQNSDAIYHRGFFEFGPLRIKTIKDTTLSGTQIHPPYVQISLKQKKKIPIIGITYDKFEEVYLHDHTNKIPCKKEFPDETVKAQVTAQIDNIYKLVFDLRKKKSPEEIKKMSEQELNNLLEKYKTTPANPSVK